MEVHQDGHHLFIRREKPLSSDVHLSHCPERAKGKSRIDEPIGKIKVISKPPGWISSAYRAAHAACSVDGIAQRKV